MRSEVFTRGKRASARCCIWVAVLGFTLAESQASAEIVNVQSLIAKEAEPGLSGAVAGDVDWRTGNTAYVFLGLTPVIRYATGAHHWVGIIRGERKRSAGQNLVYGHFEHLRYRYSLSGRLIAEVFAQNTFDGVRRLSQRTVLGMGPRVELVQNPSTEFALGVSYMLEYERIRNDNLDDADERDLAHRVSCYLTGAYEIDKKIKWGETFYVQPKVDEPSDLRLLLESQLTLSVTQTFSLSTLVTLSYDSKLPDTIKKLDSALQTRISYDF